MFRVEKKPNTPNMIWDAANNRPLCRFVKGVFETNDETLVSTLKEMGYKVEGGADAKPLDKMNLDELKAYAAEHTIDLGEAAKKADILKIIQETGNQQ